MIERTAIVGDIHGCIDEFNDLLNMLDYRSSHVRIILLGDLIDRGYYSVEVVQRARELNLECVKGNHEHKFLKWFRSSGSGSDVYDRHPHYMKFSDLDINYMTHMSDYIQIDNTVILHAGIRAGISLVNQKKDDLYYLRYVDDEKKFVSLKKINKLGKDAAHAHFWTEFGPFGYNLVYGHNVNSFDDVRTDNYADGTAAYGIDTGCCFGGCLSALILETKEIVQVKAKMAYYKSDFEIR